MRTRSQLGPNIRTFRTLLKLRQTQLICQTLYTNNIKLQPTFTQDTVLNESTNRVSCATTEYPKLKKDTASTPAIKQFSDIPKPKGLPLIGTILDDIRNGGWKNAHEISAQRHRELGPIYKKNSTVYIADLDAFRDVVPDSQVFNYGRLTSATQHLATQLVSVDWLSKEYSHLYYGVEDVLTEHMAKWHHISQRNGGRIPHLDFRIHELTFGSLSSFLMGNIASYNKQDTTSLLEKDAKKCYELIQTRRRAMMTMEVIPPLFAQKWGLSVWKRFAKATDELASIGHKWTGLIKTRKLDADSLSNYGYIDLLQLKSGDWRMVENTIAELLIDSELICTMKTWLVYMMAQNPLAQDKVVDELNSVCGKGSQFTRHHLEGVPFLRSCVKEIMRLYPASPYSRRLMEKDSVICGYNIPAQTVIELNIYTCSRNEKYFPNPHVFWPERWNSKYFGATHPFINFGLDPGRRPEFREASMARMCLFLGRLLQEFHLRCDNTVKPITRTSLLVPDKNMNLRIAKRP